MLRGLIGVLALVMFSTPSPAGVAVGAGGQESPAGVYSVSAFVYEDGRLLGTPNLTLREGEPGVVAVAGPDGYALEVAVAPVSADRIAAFGLQSGEYLEARSRLFFPDIVEDQWRIVATPEFVLQTGQRAMGESDIFSRGYQRPEGGNYTDRVTVELTVTEVDEAWLLSGDPRKTIASCTINTIDGPKSLMLAAAAQQGAISIGDPDDNCCSTGCIRCCGGCCSDAANCPTGCCPP